MAVVAKAVMGGWKGGWGQGLAVPKRFVGRSGPTEGLVQNQLDLGRGYPSLPSARAWRLPISPALLSSVLGVISFG